MALVPRARVALVSLLSLALVGSCAGRLDTKRGETKELPQPDRELKLPEEGLMKVYDNGLTLFVMPDRYTRLLQFDVRQRVGSREDPDGKIGMAHFVEHLMFQMPADGPGSAKLMSDIQRHALGFNAYTAPDETHYMHTGTADELETYFKYTALRLGYDCDAVSEAAFLRERDVVRNEHRWRGTGVDAKVRDKINALAFPEGHPYRHTTEGEDLQLASITPDDACNFIKKYYTASQATVIVAGDVNPLDVLEYANKYLEPLPKIEPPERKAVSPAKFEVKEAEIVASVEEPNAIVLFRMPRRFTKDYAASQAAIQTMFFAVAFFTSKPGSVVERWYPAGFGGKEALVFGVSVETKKARDLDRAVDEVLDAIHRGFAADLDSPDYEGSYDSVRQRARLQTLDSVANVAARAVTFAEYLEEPGQPGFYGREIAELDALTPQQAQTVGRRLFNRDTAMVVKVVPDGTKKEVKAERAQFDYQPKDEEKLSVPDDIDPAEAHEPLPLDDIAPPDGQSLEYTLDNGMRVVLVQSSGMPVMDIQMIVGVGTADSPEQPDLAMMATRFYGTREDREAGNLMSFFDLAGGIFQEDVGALASSYRTRGLSIYLDFLIAGLSEQVVQASYRSGSIEYWKDSRKDQLKKKSALLAAERENAYNIAMYGAGHPHVRPMITDPKKLRDISLRDLEQFHDEHFRAANSAIIVTGGFDMDLTNQYVAKFFGSPDLRDRKSTWNEPLATTPRAATPPPKPGDTRYMAEVDAERVQTDIRIGFPLAEAYGDDHAALAVLASMLNFRVSAVRQELGASYGVYAFLNTERPQIGIGGALDSARAGEALAAIEAAIDNLRTGEDFDRQFAFARREVLSDMLNAQGDPQLLAGRVAQAVRAGRSYDYFQELARRVATLKPAQVRKQIDTILAKSRSVTLVQGPKEGVDNVITHLKIVDAKHLPDMVHDEKD